MLLVFVALGVYRSFSSPARQKPIESAAVLPFTNETADPNAEYLSDGISESLINDLSQLQSLKVSPRNTVFRYKDKHAEAQSVGKELGVGAVLTGSLRQIGDRISISVELVDVSENRQLWGRQYVRKFADVFDMQRDITREVATQLRLKLTGEQQQSIAKQQTANPDLGRVYGASGKRAEAAKILKTLKERETSGYVSPFQTAMVHIGLNDKTKALDALEEAYEARSWYMSWLKTAPELDPLRRELRFAELLKRMNFPE